MQNPVAPVSAEEAAWTDRYMPYERVYDREVTAPTAQTINLATIRGFVWRQRLVLIGVTVLALVAGFVLTLLSVPVYEATATVRVDAEEADIFQGESLAPNLAGSDIDSYLATLTAVIESRSMARQVAQSLSPATRAELLAKSGTELPASLTPRQREERQVTALAGMLQGGVSADPPMNERIIAIEYRSNDPRLAAAIANGYAENFLTDDIRRSLQKNSYAQQYLEKEIAQVRTNLDQAERQALAYARANNIVGQSILTGSTAEGGADAAPQTITATNLAAINTTFSDARARRISTEQRWRAVAGTPASNLPEFQQNTAAQSLIARRSQVSAELAEARVRYGPEHPQVRELQAQVSTLDRQVNQIGSEIKNSLRNEFEIAARQEQALSNELQQVSGRTLDEQDRRVAFNQLNGTAQALRTQLQALLERYNQIAASANVKPSTITLLDPAIVPRAPVSPNLWRNLLIALVLGAGAAFALAILRETLDDRLRSGEEVEKKLGTALLGLTPLVGADEEVSESSALAEAYSSIRAAVDFALPKPNHNVVLLTSSQSVEGKTTTALALAREYARLGRKVLLVDADLRRPSIAKSFGFKRPARGFAEVLAGDVEMREVLMAQSQHNLDVLPVGALPPNPVEVVSSQRLDDFVERYRTQYDLIVIDSPPVMGLADAPLLSRVADGVIFVVESNRAHFGQAKTALRRLRDADARVLGVVLTKFRALEAGQSYGYGYQYYTYGDKAAAE